MAGAVYRRPSAGAKNKSDEKSASTTRSRDAVEGPRPANSRTENRTAPKVAPHTPAAPASATPTGAPSKASGRAAVTRQREGGTSAWNVRITPSALIMLCMLLLVTLSFFFLFGLIIGRGAVPVTSPAELQQFLHPGPDTAPETPERILPEEDLRFMTNLRVDAQNTTLPEEGLSAGGVSQAPLPAQIIETPPASPPAPVSPDLNKYDFVLRAAAFKAEDQADALRLKLEDAGMRTKLVREKAQVGTWFHVQILYRGTTENLQVLRDGLADFGIKDSIIASKTLVE